MLSRQWFDFAFENPDMIKSEHTAIYFLACEQWNRFGQKEKFGFPSYFCMEVCGIKNHKTYQKYFDDLVEWGFIKLIQESKNQYSSCIIALVKNTKAVTKALDKALTNHIPKQVQGTVTIDKQINNITNKQINKGSKEPRIFSPFEQKIIDFVEHRKKIKKPMTKHALELLTNKLEKMSPGNTDTKIQILDQSILS